jgi:hypothetical protein
MGIEQTLEFFGSHKHVVTSSRPRRQFCWKERECKWIQVGYSSTNRIIRIREKRKSIVMLQLQSASGPTIAGFLLNLIHGLYALRTYLFSNFWLTSMILVPSSDLIVFQGVGLDFVQITGKKITTVLNT